MKIGLVQINNSFPDTYFPYSVGCLQAYVQKYSSFVGEWEFLLPVFKRMSVHNAVKGLLSADIVCFSLYTWNKNMSAEIMRGLKKRKPNILVVAGGPQIPGFLPSDPKRTERFLKQYPYLDMVCHLEGEQSFQAILENAFGDWRRIPSISFLGQDGNVVSTPIAPRLPQEKIYELPSPYLEGVFDPLIKANPESKWVVLWETNRGCPFSCTFCDWGSLVANKVFKFKMERLKRELEWIAQHNIEFVFCADANFAIFERDIELAQYAAEMRARYGYPKALSVQNAKNASERVFTAQYVLAKAGLNKGVTLAFQSRDLGVLDNVARKNISLEDFRTLQKRFTKAGIETYSDMIIALAGETYDSFANGVSDTIADGQHNRIQFGNLSNMPGAEMSDPVSMQKYGMVTQKVKAVTYHGVVHNAAWEVDEDEELVIATNSMPPKDWVRTRAFAWMAAFLHFDKILQIPLVIAKEICGVTYRSLIEVFSECTNPSYPIILEIKNFFLEKARNIQQGYVEYCTGPNRLNIWWPADEFIFIKLMYEAKRDDFYTESLSALFCFLQDKHPDIEAILQDAITLNRGLIKLPFLYQDKKIVLSYNILEFYNSVRVMEKIELEKRRSVCIIDRTTEQWVDWNEWMQKVVWWGNKKGAYLYGNVKTDHEMAGHY